jgi:hypothetical protein
MLIPLDAAVVADRSKTMSTLQPIGYVISRHETWGDEPVAVRISNGGNLCDAGTPDAPTGVYNWGSKRAAWPTIYATEAEAWAAIEAKAAKCLHDYLPVSHEESQCTKCGDRRFDGGPND